MSPERWRRSCSTVIAPLPWLSNSGRWLTSRSVEPELALVDQDHDGGGGGDRLGERGHVEDRVAGHRLVGRLHPAAERLGVGDLAVTADQDDRAGDDLVVDGLVDRLTTARAGRGRGRARPGRPRAGAGGARPGTSRGAGGAVRIVFMGWRTRFGSGSGRDGPAGDQAGGEDGGGADQGVPGPGDGGGEGVDPGERGDTLRLGQRAGPRGRTWRPRRRPGRPSGPERVTLPDPAGEDAEQEQAEQDAGHERGDCQGRLDHRLLLSRIAPRATPIWTSPRDGQHLREAEQTLLGRVREPSAGRGR